MLPGKVCRTKCRDTHDLEGCMVEVSLCVDLRYWTGFCFVLVLDRRRSRGWHVVVVRRSSRVDWSGNRYIKPGHGNPRPWRAMLSRCLACGAESEDSDSMAAWQFTSTVQMLFCFLGSSFPVTMLSTSPVHSWLVPFHSSLQMNLRSISLVSLRSLPDLVRSSTIHSP